MLLYVQTELVHKCVTLRTNRTKYTNMLLHVQTELVHKCRILNLSVCYLELDNINICNNLRKEPLGGLGAGDKMGSSMNLKRQRVDGLEIFRGNRGQEEDALRRASWIVLDTGYCSGVQIKKNQMGGACRMYEWQGQGMQDFCAESAGKRQTGRRIGRWGEVSSKWIFKK